MAILCKWQLKTITKSVFLFRLQKASLYIFALPLENCLYFSLFKFLRHFWIFCILVFYWGHEWPSVLEGNSVVVPEQVLTLMPLGTQAWVEPRAHELGG